MWLALAVAACLALPALASADPLPANVFAPEVTGDAVDGQTLKVDPAGVWAVSLDPQDISHRWQRCDSAGSSCADIPGATATEYVLTSSDVGHRVRVVETATNATGATESESEPTAPVQALAPQPQGAPTVFGVTREGETLSAQGASWGGSGPPATTYAFQWERCDAFGSGCAAVPGATGASYGLGAGDVGHTLRVRQSASNSAGSASATSAATGRVERRPGPPPPPPPPPPPSPPPPPPPLKPVFGGPQLVRPVAGTVLVKPKGATAFVRVETLTLIPDGSMVKTLRGVADVIVADNRAGTKRSAIRARQATFVVHQRTSGTPLTDLTLADPLDCRRRPRRATAASGARAIAHASARRRRLFSRARGRFRTRGRYASAIVRGTAWSMTDTCTGTLTRATEGLVEVRDQVLRRTILVPAGRSYLARAR